MAGILIYSEKTELAVELLAAARTISGATGWPVNALCINDDSQAAVLAGQGAAVMHARQAVLNCADTGAMASAIKQAVACAGASMVLLSSDRRGKELAGRVAAELRAGCLTDVRGFQLSGERVEWTRNVLGGASVATQSISTDYQVAALAPGQFAAGDVPVSDPALSHNPGYDPGAGSITCIDVDFHPTGVKLVAINPRTSSGIDIESARNLVVVGMGVEEEGQLAEINQIVKILDGEIACSKPVATDRKWYDEERIIGLSGKACRPELALILGVSGQVQFTVGIRDARTIVSINRDENAGINSLADYILTADLKEAIPALKAALSQI